MTPIPQPRMPMSPWRLSGVVYGALLNHAPELAALGEAAHAAPYKSPPQAPVLQLRPRNTLAADGARVEVPADGVVVGASLGLVIGRSACRVAAADALAHVAGYLVVADLSSPMTNPVGQHYRPTVRHRARDGFCVLGPEVVPAAALPSPDALVVQVLVDGQSAQTLTQTLTQPLTQTTDTAQRLRGVAQLLADVSDFMTLQSGDVLLMGASAGAPVARAGQAVEVRIAGMAGLRFELVAEPAR